MKMIAAVASILIFAVSARAAADEEMQFNIVNLRVEQAREVANDVMVVIMQAAAQKNSSAEAARSVNETMSWADSVIAGDQRIRHKTINYQTRPVYQNKSITGWSASQQLQLQSEDIEALTALAGTLQQRLHIVPMRFQVSDDRRAEELETLIVEALEAFRTKAQLIAATLKAQDYRIVALSINENGGPRPYQAVVQAEAMTARATAPSVEAGDSEIQVSVSGSIQLIF